MTHQKIYSGISKAAWGYFFLYFNLNINTVSLTPSFVGFLLFLSALKLLQDEEREVVLLRPLGILLALWHGIGWFASWFGTDPSGHPFPDLIIALSNLYFHFQLLTNIASIASRYQPEGSGHDEQLLKCRTIQTLMLTGVIILGYLSSFLAEIWAYISLCMGLTYVIAGIVMIRALLAFRKDLQ